MPLIRDTINPLREREVSDEEALDLERMGIALTGTRAKTDDGLTAAAIRQVTERQEGGPLSTDGPTVTIGVGELDDEDQAVNDGSQTPGDAPDSTTDTRTDSQES